MLKRSQAASVLVLVLTAAAGPGAQQGRYRTLDDSFPPPPQRSMEEWKVRAAYLREHILASAGLVPMPQKTALNPVVFGDTPHQDYIVSKVYFESLPGFFVTGNLYRPIGDGPFPAILSPHGHWAYGRLENSEHASIPGRAINLARQGFVVFTYDMIGYNDSRQLPHTFGGDREKLWGLTLAGLQLWNSIRSLDFLQTLSYVKRDAIGATGASGGGTQTFLVAAVDDRVSVAAPVNMISLHMQGGCLCENEPGLRLDTTNVEIASTIAPRPLLMVSATGDWTKNTMELEYPAVRKTYLLFDAPDRVHGVRVDAPHNYNRDSREAVYAWMARWLQGAPADVRRPERNFTPDPLPDTLVFHNRALPSAAVTPAQLTENWIAAAKAQLAAANKDAAERALRHALGFAAEAAPPTAAKPVARAPRTVLLANPDAELESLLKRDRVAVSAVSFTPFDAEAAAKIRLFDTYNRTAASQRVADIVAAARAQPGAVLVAQGDAALGGFLAAAIAPISLAVLDVGAFDPNSDTDFVQHLLIPGVRRAGDLQTAASMAAGRLVVHNAGDKFNLAGVQAGRQKLTAREIAALIEKK
jgi:dienelactone hydrolase